jgi:hypothetical protein
VKPSNCRPEDGVGERLLASPFLDPCDSQGHRSGLN